MNKNLSKPYTKNVRLDKPCGLIGVPPDAPFPGAMHNVIVIAKLTDNQYNTLINCLCPNSLTLPQ